MLAVGPADTHGPRAALVAVASIILHGLLPLCTVVSSCAGVTSCQALFPTTRMIVPIPWWSVSKVSHAVVSHIACALTPRLLPDHRI